MNTRLKNILLNTKKIKLEKKNSRVALFVGLLLLLIVGGIVSLQQVFKKESQAAWWNGDYKYRTAYSFTASSAVSSERKVKIDVDTATLITAGKMQSDCDDVRFTAADGKLLDYFIDTNTADCNTSSTDFYIKVPSVASGGNLIYMYYGNSSTSRSDLGGRKNDFFSPENLGVGLKGYWNLNETTANTCTGGTNDSCDRAFTNDGFWYGNATYVAAGKLNGAVTFDGTNDAVEATANTDLSSSTTLTISFWAAAASYQDTNAGVAIRNGTISTNAIMIYPYDTNGGNGARVIHTDTGIINQNSTSVAADSTWHHFVFVSRSATDHEMYVDNVSVGTSSTSKTVPASLTNVDIGNWYAGSSQEFAGQIDDVRVYKTALNTTQISALYNSGNGQEIPLMHTFTPSSGPTAASEETTPGPVAYWKFDEGQGQSVNDNTSHNNDGTLGANSSSSSDDPTWKQESDCVSGKCLQFDGSADYVNTNLTSALSAMTVTAWIKTPDVTYSRDGTYIQDIVANWVNGDKSFELRIGDGTQGGAGKLVVSIGTGNSDETETSNLTVASNQWTFVAFTYSDSGNNVTIYKNTQSSSSTNSITMGGTSTVQIGRLGWGGATDRNFKGFIDEVKIYPYARSAAEIKADYSAGAAVLGLSDQKDYLSDGLVGYWKMDEASANTCTGGTNDSCDSSGNGNDGAWNGDATTTTGKFGNAVILDGNGDFVTPSSDPTSGLSSFTVSAWIKPSSIVNNTAILGNWSTSKVLFRMTGAGALQGYILNNGSIQYGGDLGLTLSSGTWQHAVLTYDGRYLTGYLNGTRGTTPVAASGAVGSSTGLSIGGNSSSASSMPFYGSIDDFRIYNRALSADDVRNLYNWGPEPIAHWKFDEGSGQSPIDSSPNSNTLTLGDDTSSTNEDPSWTVGKYSSGLNFDGSNDYAHCTDANCGGTNKLDNGTRNWTIGAWIKLQSTGTNQMIIEKGGGTFTTTNYNLSIDTNNDGNFVVYNGVNGQTYCDVDGSVDLTDNQWHYMSGVLNQGVGCYLYVDGALYASDTSLVGTPQPNTATTFHIGERTGNSYPVKGLVDNIVIYDYARTPSQIVEDMNAGHPLGGSPVGSQTGYWSFDEQQGQTANDRSATGSYDGTLGANTGSSTDDPTWKTKTDCKINGCLSFDGGDFVATSYTTAFGTNDVTYTAWFKAPDTNQAGMIMSKRSSGAMQLSVFVGGSCVGASGQGLYVLEYPGSSRCASTTTDVADNQWHHLAVVRSSTIQLYLDGKLVSTATGSVLNLTNTDALRIGDGNGEYRFTGSVDEPKLYLTALTADQIRADMNAGSAVSYSVLGSSEAADLTDGAGNPPVGEWLFDENTGTSANDTSGNGNTGTLTSGPTWTAVTGAPKEANGLANSALNFDGSDDYVNVTSSTSLQVTGAISVSAWVKTSSLGSGGGIISKSTDAQKYFGVAAQKVYELGVLGTDLYWQVSNGTTAISVNTSFSSYINNNWHHVMGVWDGTTGSTAMKIYIDGRLITTAAGTGMTTIQTTSDALDIGGFTTNYNWNGQIDGAKIYNYARTAAQVAYDYNRGAPVGHWKLDECQGSTANDASGNGNHGTITIGASGGNTSVGTCTGSAGEAWKDGASGKYSASLDFDGTDDYVGTLGPAANFNFTTQPFTLSAWFKLSPSSGAQHVVGNLNGSNGYAINVNATSNFVRFIMYTGNVQVDSPTTLSDNTWYHVTVVYTGGGGDVYLYLNGKLDASADISNTISSSSNPINIGRRLDDSNFFNGQIDDVRVYNYALSASQVRKVMNEGSAVRYGQ